MCKGVDKCPKTGASIESAPCKLVANFHIGPDCATVRDGVLDELPRILQVVGGNGVTASTFFSTGWTGNRT